METNIIPISFARTASGLLISVTNLAASRRISMTLLRRANTGARGKDATKSVTKPYWITRKSKHTKKTLQIHKVSILRQNCTIITNSLLNILPKYSRVTYV